MNRMMRTGATGMALLASLAWGSAPARAEVGVSRPGTDRLPYILAQITDDSDPWGAAWNRLGTSPDRDVLNDAGGLRGDGLPSIAIHSDGRVLVAWPRNSEAGFDVVLSVHAGAGWSEPQVVAGSTSDEVSPSLVVAPGGDVHLVYSVGGSDPRVVHRQAPADLSSWSEETRVSPAGDPARSSSAAWHAGALRVVYELNDFGLGQTPRKIVLARHEAGAFQPEIVAVTAYDGDTGPRVNSHAGRMWVEWVDAADELAWTRLDAQGQWEPLRYEPFVSARDREFHVRPGVRLEAVAP
jgi:hypothetical protein